MTTTPSPLVARSRAGAIVVALLLIGAGTLWLLAAGDVVTVEAADVLALALLVVGAGLLVTSWRGRGYALVPLGFVLVGVLVAGEVIDVPLGAGVGDRTVIVDTVDELGTHHELFVGDMTIDLTDAPLRAGRTAELEASVAAGELRVIVPRSAVVEVTATARAGQVTSPGGRDTNENGFLVDTSFTLDPVPPDDPGGSDDTDATRRDPPRLVLDLSVGVGEVEVTRG